MLFGQDKRAVFFRTLSKYFFQAKMVSPRPLEKMSRTPMRTATCKHYSSSAITAKIDEIYEGRRNKRLKTRVTFLNFNVLNIAANIIVMRCDQNLQGSAATQSVLGGLG